MHNYEDHIKKLYLENQYLQKNDLDLSEEGGEQTRWKISQILPLIDKYLTFIKRSEINILDVGGGVGLILKMVSSSINKKYHIKVNKYSIDLSPGFLEIQRKNNPDLKQGINEDIRKTSLSDKEMHLVLMVDVLEHVPEPISALKELRRISQFVIFKVPLENNLLLNSYNFLTKNKQRLCGIDTVGHINFYNFNRLKQQIEENTGKIIDYYFTNIFDHYRKVGYYNNKNKLKKYINFVASNLFKFSPLLCSKIFNDFVVILVKCK